MFETCEYLENIIKIWAYSGKYVTEKEWETFKKEYENGLTNPMMEGMDFPVSKKLYEKNKYNPNWLI